MTRDQKLDAWLKKRAGQYAQDNSANPTDYLVVENAVLFGARLAAEFPHIAVCTTHVAEEIPGDYYAEDAWRSDSTYCKHCGIHLGWYCPSAPDHYCHYDQGHSDCCDFCEMPDERK